MVAFVEGGRFTDGKRVGATPLQVCSWSDWRDFRRRAIRALGVRVPHFLVGSTSARSTRSPPIDDPMSVMVCAGRERQRAF